MIKALIFDCFGVFFVDPVYAYMSDPDTPPNKARVVHDLDRQAAVGLLDKQGFIDQAASLMDRPPAEIERRFFKGLHRNQRLIDFSQNLRPDYKIAMLSNIGGDMMDGFFTVAERGELFDLVVLSGEVKLAKPDPTIFKLTCERLGVSADEAIMIDDIQSNVEAAKRLGMQGIRYEHFGQFKSKISAYL
jgi:HAD superfamily hydrolase (TIGR01549 family)